MLKNRFYKPNFSATQIYWCVFLVFHLGISFFMPKYRFITTDSEVTPAVAYLSFTLSIIGTVGIIGYVFRRPLGKQVYWRHFFKGYVFWEIWLLLGLSHFSPMLILGKTSVLQYVLVFFYHYGLFKYAYDESYPYKKTEVADPIGAL